MKSKIIDFKEKAKERAVDDAAGRQVVGLEASLHTFFKEEKVPSDVAMHALIRYAARIAVQSMLPRKAFAGACDKVYKDIAKELRS